MTFTMYSYPFTYRYYRANDRDFEFDNMELIVSDFFNQIINAYNSSEKPITEFSMMGFS